MKSLQTVATMLIFVVTIFSISSCSQNETLVPVSSKNVKVDENTSLDLADVSKNDNLIEHIDRGARLDPSITTITFNSIQPAIGGRTTPTLGGQSTSCGLFQPGKCVINVVGRSGNELLLRVQPGDGTPFKYSGLLAIKSGSVCGEVLNQVAISSTLFGQDIRVKITTPGIVKLYAVLVLNSNQLRYYSNPITIDVTESLSVSVTSNDLTYLPRHGQFGYVAGIAVYSNGSTYDYYETDRSKVNNVDVGSKWQCVELVKRFYFTKYGVRIANVTYAKQLFGVAGISGLRAYRNAGSEGPRVGDIIVMDEKPGAIAGHTAIVSKVAATYIEVAQQNVYRDKHLNYRISRNGNTVSNTMGYPVIGWIR